MTGMTRWAHMFTSYLVLPVIFRRVFSNQESTLTHNNEIMIIIFILFCWGVGQTKRGSLRLCTI